MYSIEEIKIICEVIKKRRYWLPKYFNELSCEEIRSYSNGIGAEFFPKFLRKWLTELFFIFEATACIHDVEYAIGGSYWTFTIANIRFAVNGFKAALRMQSIKFACYAVLFGILCQLFGYKAFNKKESTA
jgi:hypothetical protein